MGIVVCGVVCDRQIDLGHLDSLGLPWSRKISAQMPQKRSKMEGWAAAGNKYGYSDIKLSVRDSEAKITGCQGVPGKLQFVAKIGKV